MVNANMPCRLVRNAFYLSAPFKQVFIDYLFRPLYDHSVVFRMSQAEHITVHRNRKIIILSGLDLLCVKFCRQIHRTFDVVHVFYFVCKGDTDCSADLSRTGRNMSCRQSNSVFIDQIKISGCCISREPHFGRKRDVKVVSLVNIRPVLAGIPLHHQ